MGDKHCDFCWLLSPSNIFLIIIFLVRWILDHMASDSHWPVTIFLRCNIATIRQMFHRLVIHVIQVGHRLIVSDVESNPTTIQYQRTTCRSCDLETAPSTCCPGSQPTRTTSPTRLNEQKSAAGLPSPGFSRFLSSSRLNLNSGLSEPCSTFWKRGQLDRI